MSELIDRSAIKLPPHFFENVDNVPKFYEWLNSLPTIDAVPVKSICESVNHPAHYNNGLYECIDLMREIYGDEMVRSFCILNAYKYRFRAGKKQGAAAKEDIAKAEWYEQYVMEKIPQNYAAWAERRNQYNTCKEDRSEKDAE